MDETYSEEQWKRFTHGAYLPYRQPFQSGVENVILALDMGDDPRSAVNNLARDISIFKLEMADLLRADNLPEAALTHWDVDGATQQDIATNLLNMLRQLHREFQTDGDQEFRNPGPEDGLDENAATISAQDIPREFVNLFNDMCAAAWRRDDYMVKMMSEAMARAWQSSYLDAPQGDGMAVALAKLAKIERKNRDFQDAEQLAPANWASLDEFFDDEDDAMVEVTADPIIRLAPQHDQAWERLLTAVGGGDAAQITQAVRTLGADLIANGASPNLDLDELVRGAERETRLRRKREAGEAVPAGFEDDLLRVALAFAHHNLGEPGEDAKALAVALAQRLSDDAQATRQWTAVEVYQIANRFLVSADHLDLRGEAKAKMEAAKERAIYKKDEREAAAVADEFIAQRQQARAAKISEQIPAMLQELVELAKVSDPDEVQVHELANEIQAAYAQIDDQTMPTDRLIAIAFAKAEQDLGQDQNATDTHIEDEDDAPENEGRPEEHPMLQRWSVGSETTSFLEGLEQGVGSLNEFLIPPNPPQADVQDNPRATMDRVQRENSDLDLRAEESVDDEETNPVFAGFQLSETKVLNVGQASRFLNSYVTSYTD